MDQIFRTLGRGSRPQLHGQNEVLLSGIICVTLNQKASQPKFVEVTHNAIEKKTALYIHKTRDKRRTEAAIDLTQSTVFIEYETANVVGIINRENRIYTLRLEKDREELERFVAQWRSVLTVSQHPDDMFSVITVSGEDRGSVILITAYDDDPSFIFKHMSGLKKNSEFRLSQFVKVDKLSKYEVSVEALSGESYHFISKRPDTLSRKLKTKLVEEDLSQSLPTKSRNNSAALYDSKQGYTPTFQTSREVTHVTADYLSRDQLNTALPSRADYRLPPPIPDPRLPLPPESKPPLSPAPPRRNVPPPPTRPGPDYTLPNSFVGGARVPPVAPDYIPMDHPSGLEAQDDYLTMDQMAAQDDYLTMDQMPAQDDYLTMDQKPTSDPDYLIMDSAFQDPLIADYLTMDEMGNCQKFDDYPAHERPADPDIGFEDDEDIYFDPGLAPPPVPPRIEDKSAPVPLPLPPRIEERPNLPTKSSLSVKGPESGAGSNEVDDDDDDRTHMSHTEVLELLKKLKEKGSRGSVNPPKTVYCDVVLERPPPPPPSGAPPYPPPLGDIASPLPQFRPAQRTPTLYSEVQLRARNAISESSSTKPTRRHSEQPTSTIRHHANVPDFLPPPPPTNYSEVEIGPRPDISPSRPPPAPLPARRVSEQSHHLPRPKSSHLDDSTVNKVNLTLTTLLAEVEIRPRPDISPSRQPPSRQQPAPLPARRVSEQPHHLPRPKSSHLDDVTVHKVEPVLPPRTNKDQLRPKPAKVDKKKKKKKSQRPRSAVYPEEVSPPNPRGPAENTYLMDRSVRSPVSSPQVVPPPLAPRRI